MAENDAEPEGTIGPVLFAYDGSELAAFAIARAGLQLGGHRQALVVCVWQPADVGFSPITPRHFDADQAGEVRAAAAETADYGVSLAERAGFQAQRVVIEAAPTWKGIVETADEREAGLIVIGSHRHGGIWGHLVGNVAAAVIAHAHCPVFVVRRS